MYVCVHTSNATFVLTCVISNSTFSFLGTSGQHESKQTTKKNSTKVKSHLPTCHLLLKLTHQNTSSCTRSPLPLTHRVTMIRSAANFSASFLPAAATTTTSHSFVFTSLFSTQPQPLNRARRGLYGGKRVIFGNNVSHSKRRTRRKWSPNVQTKKYHSELLDEKFQIKVTTSVMRTIKKYGGLDGYLLNTSEKKLYDSDFGRKLKVRVSKAEATCGKIVSLSKEQTVGE